MNCACVSSPILCPGIKAKIEHLSYAAAPLHKHPCETNINFHVDNITGHNNQHKSWQNSFHCITTKIFLSEFTAKYFLFCTGEYSSCHRSTLLNPSALSLTVSRSFFPGLLFFTHGFRKLKFRSLRGKFQRRKYSMRRFRKTFDFYFYHKQIEEETLNLR